MYKVELLSQHDGSFEEFSFRAERSVTQKDDVIFFVYEASRGLTPISASYDKNRMPLDYFVVGTNSSTKRFYVESGNATNFAEITMDDPSLRECGWSSGNATEIQAYYLALKGKRASCWDGHSFLLNLVKIEYMCVGEGGRRKRRGGGGSGKREEEGRGKWGRRTGFFI